MQTNPLVWLEVYVCVYVGGFHSNLWVGFWLNSIHNDNINRFCSQRYVLVVNLSNGRYVGQEQPHFTFLLVQFLVLPKGLMSSFPWFPLTLYYPWITALQSHRSMLNLLEQISVKTVSTFTWHLKKTNYGLDPSIAGRLKRMERL